VKERITEQNREKIKWEEMSVPDKVR